MSSTWCSHCQGPEFDSWSRNKDRTSCLAWPKKQTENSPNKSNAAEARQTPHLKSVQFSHSVVSDPLDFSTLGFPVHHQLLEPTQTHVYRVGDAIQLSHPLSTPSPPTFSLSQHQGLFQGVNSSHEVAKVLEFQLQHQSFQ